MVKEKAFLAMHAKDNGGRDGAVMAGVDANRAPRIFGIAQCMIAQDSFKETYKGRLIPYRQPPSKPALEEGLLQALSDFSGGVREKGVGMICLRGCGVVYRGITDYVNSFP